MVVYAANNPYAQVVWVTNSIAWPYNEKTYGNDSFQLGDSQNEDTLLLQTAARGYHFPASFAFAVASAAYQYEGNRQSPTMNCPEGVGWSMWDVFSEKYSWLNPQGTNVAKVPPTSKYTKPSGEQAVQGFYPSYYLQDLDAMKKLGVNYYRLSVSWPRLFPRANMTKPDPAGVKYYVTILEELKKRNIRVLITLYHWDLPAWLYNFGSSKKIEKNKTYGWLDTHEAKDNLTLKEFQKYAAASYRLFGPYTPYFSTFNEPLTFTNSAFTDGVHAPGRYGREELQALDPEQYGKNLDDYLEKVPYLQAINVIKAHYIAYKTIHSIYEHDKHRYSEAPKVSIVLNSDWAEPYRILCDKSKKKCRYHPDDIRASKNNMDFMLGWWLNPVMFGTWPRSMQAIYSNRIKTMGLSSNRETSCLREDGVPVICDRKNKNKLAEYIRSGGALDLLAINHYTGYFVVDFDYAKTHYQEIPGENAVPYNQYHVSPNQLQKGWYSDQHAFITQFRYRKQGTQGEKPHAVKTNPNQARVYVIGSSGNKPWLRQTWFVYHKLLQYIYFYYLQNSKVTKMGIPFSALGIYLTENGTSIQGESQQKTLDDANRIQYVLGNLAAVQQALDEKLPVKLYTYWSITDNFEWSEGYDTRFGLIRINYEDNFRREPKYSYYCYQSIITNHGKLSDRCQSGLQLDNQRRESSLKR